MNHDRRAETRFVGENAPLESLGHDGADDVADTAAGRRYRLKGSDKNRLEGRQDVGVVDADNNKTSRHEKNDHKRHDLLRYGGDPL